MNSTALSFLFGSYPGTKIRASSLDMLNDHHQSPIHSDAHSQIYTGRAILGRQNLAGQWEPIILSVDQTGYNEDEVARLQSKHPDEPEMVKDGRLLGLAVTRAFGDGLWKVCIGTKCQNHS